MAYSEDSAERMVRGAYEAPAEADVYREIAERAQLAEGFEGCSFEGCEVAEGEHPYGFVEHGFAQPPPGAGELVREGFRAINEMRQAERYRLRLIQEMNENHGDFGK